jgi:DNA transformation protein
LASDFQSFLEDLFAPLGGVRFRRMFSGLGVYRDGVMFALVSDDVLYFKVDDTTRGAFEDEGCAPFRYEARGRSVALSYWRLPERLFDEPDEFKDWALAAVGVADRAKMGAGPAKKRGSGKAGAARRRP